MKITNLIIKAVIGLALTGMPTSFAHAADTAASTNTVKRVVIKTPVKQRIMPSNYMHMSNKHLVKTYGTQQSAAKVIRPKVQKTRTPNLYTNSSK